VKHRRHTPEQVVRKLREADHLLGEGADIPAVCHPASESGCDVPKAYSDRERVFGTSPASGAADVLPHTTQKVLALRWRGCPNRREIGGRPATQLHVCVNTALWMGVEVEKGLVPQVEVGAIALVVCHVDERVDCS